MRFHGSLNEEKQFGKKNHIHVSKYRITRGLLWCSRMDFGIMLSLLSRISVFLAFMRAAAAAAVP